MHQQKGKTPDLVVFSPALLSLLININSRDLGLIDKTSADIKFEDMSNEQLDRIINELTKKQTANEQSKEKNRILKRLAGRQTVID